MDPEKVKAALEAIEAGDAAKALELLKGMIAAAAGGGEESASDPPAAASEALAEGAEPPPEKPEDEEAAASKAALAKLSKLTGKSSAGEAVAVVEGVLTRLAKIEAREAALELSARRELIADLVRLGKEYPSTAWEGDPEDRKPCKRLASEPIEDLRARVALYKQHEPAGSPAPPERAAPDATKLSKQELAACKARGIDPKDFAERKASAVRRSA